MPDDGQPRNTGRQPDLAGVFPLRDALSLWAASQMKPASVRERAITRETIRLRLQYPELYRPEALAEKLSYLEI
jgi:hypothetical protein